MRSFRFKTRRTRKYASNGLRIYSTLNSTSKVPKYKNTNPRFDSKCQTRYHGGANGCTHAGCGKECCLLPILLEDITSYTWDNSPILPSLSPPASPVDMGNAFAKNTKVYSGGPAGSGELIGTIYATIYPYTNCCIIPGFPSSDYPHDETNVGKDQFPIAVRLLLIPASGTCNQNRWRAGMPLYFGNNLNPLYTAPNTTALDASANAHKEFPIKTGLATIGQPYRNPIAGYRKTLVCCDPVIKCKDCVLVYTIVDWPGIARPAIGDDVRAATGILIGQVINVVDNGLGGSVTVRPIGDCEDYTLPTQGGLVIGGTQYTSISQLEKITDSNCIKLGATNDIYKDNYARSCESDARACYDPRIRSGMQPKQQFCVEYTKTFDGYKKHKRLLCTKDLGFQKKYNYSYAQYLQNSSNKSFARSQEKYLPNPLENPMSTSVTSNCPSSSQCRSTTPCCQRSLYRKSGGNACAACCVEQTVTATFDQPPPQPNQPVYTLRNAADNGDLIGTSTNVTDAPGPSNNITIKLINCNKRVDASTQRIKVGAAQSLGAPTNVSGIQQTSAINGMGVTTYKPNNKKFQVQGAVSSGSRMERLKLDVIRESGSKCIKGQRCRILGPGREKYGKGRYLAGRPQFMGWIYNARHPETTCMQKYRQQPLGIPQLTRRSIQHRATRSNRIPGARPARSVLVNNIYQRNDATGRRAPGCNCPTTQCLNPCLPAAPGPRPNVNNTAAVYCPVNPVAPIVYPV